MTAYYNEIDPYAAQWLRNLIAAGHIAAGDVDERPIQEVKPDDVRPYTQAHFFAGIGGWSCALRLAGWPDDRPVWTGSCPCQPFSAAGKQEACADERHLWPHWGRLIRERRPATVYGEQVASAIAFGWLDEVAHDLEAQGYAVAAAVLPACAAGAFHRRDRLWFVAHAGCPERRPPAERRIDDDDRADTGRQETAGGFELHGEGIALADPQLPKKERLGEYSREILPQQEPIRYRAGREHVGDSSISGFQVNKGSAAEAESTRGGVSEYADTAGIMWLRCPDGKSRPVEPGIRLLAHGIPCRVAKLRAGGNAIDPRVAAEFIKATAPATSEVAP